MGKKIVIFGTGKFFYNRKNEFNNDEIVAYIDNDSSRWGVSFFNKCILSPSEILECDFDYVITMARPSFSEQMICQLFKIGIPLSKILNYDQYKLLRECISPKKLVVFGTGVFYERRKRIFYGDHVICFIDNNHDKQGNFKDGSLILSLADVSCSVDYDYVVIMTNPKNKDEILKQLKVANVHTDKILDYYEYMHLVGKSELDSLDDSDFVKSFFKNNKLPGLSLDKKLNIFNGQPLISVITPFYNAGKYFEQTFNCVMNQTFPWFEWIIINDGSTNQDDINLLNEFAKKDCRIKVINTPNCTLPGARNNGFENAVCDFVTQIDADDLISPQYLEYVYWGLKLNPEAGWAYTWSTGFQNQYYLWRKPFVAETMKYRNDLIEVSTIRKSTWIKANKYKVEGFSYNEDWRFWLDCMSVHEKPVSLGGYLSWYRRTDTGMLQSIKLNEKIVTRNKEIIENAAKTVDITLKAKHYPSKNVDDAYKKIEVFDWDYSYNVKKNENDKRILWIIPWMVMGGADKFNVDAISGLAENGWDVSIITTLASDNNWRYKFEEFTHEIYNLPEFLDINNYLPFVEYYIKSRNIDVLMVTNSTLGYHMIPYLRMKFPELVIIDYVHMEEWYWRAGGHARTAASLNEVLEKTFVCNTATEQVMRKYFNYDESKCDTLHIGVADKIFDSSKVESGYLYSIIGIEKSRPIVLFPCRIDPQKRPFMIIDIAKGVLKVLPEVMFVVVGDGPQLQELKDSILKNKLNNNIKCIGRSDQMAKCYKDAKLTLICSLKEGLSLTAYESCSMGVPVISSDVGGQKDLIDSSVGALISTNQVESTCFDSRDFDENEIKEYSDNIVALLTDDKLYKECSLNCRKKIEEGFSISRMVERLNNEILHIMNDESYRKNRKNLSLMLQKTENLVKEVYTLSSVIESF